MNFVNGKGELLTLLGSKNTDGVIVVERNELNNVRRCEGTITAPSGKKGYDVGAFYINTSTGVLYINTGTTTSCTFTSLATAAYGSITDTANGKSYTLSTTNGVLQVVEV